MRIVVFTCALVLLLAASRDAPTGDADALQRVLGTVRGSDLRAHMEVLAADDMRGREAGTAAFQVAADYVASQFAAVGLAPLGDHGTYFQEIQFIESRLVPGSASFTLHRGDVDVPLRFNEDFVRLGGFGAPEESVSAPLVFVGFGVRAPEYAHDDFADVNVAGRILVVLTGAPPRFDTDQRAFYSSSAGKRALALALGALGIVTVRTPVDQERTPWSRVVAGVGSPAMRWLEADGTPHDGFTALVGDAALSEAGAQRLFEFAGHDLEALFERHTSGATGSFELGVNATLRRGSEQRQVASPNVVGLLRGSDPRLREQYILYTAHLDHLGIRPDPSGDEIHNGAYDNATGVATVLVITRALANMSPPPRRSILFAAVTGEEKGLRGSDYLAHHPPVPIDNLVANINIDMPFLGYPMADVEPIGVEHSTLQDAVARAAADLGLASTPDTRPELVRFIRSDQFSFVQRGVPGLNLKPGATCTDPNVDGDAMRSQFLREHYHRPSDDLSLPFSSEGAEAFVRTALALGLIVASDDNAPRWKDGDFFGERFARRRPPELDGNVIHGER